MSPLRGIADAVTGVFGEDVTITPSSTSTPVTIRAEFSTKPMQEGEFVIERDVVTAKTAEVAGLVDGDPVEVRGTAYVCRFTRDDGEGLTDIILQKSGA